MGKYQAYPEYKNSGVEWLDVIPSHWTPASLKMLVDVRDGTHDTPEYVETAKNTYPLVTSKDVTSGRLRFDLCKHISEQDYLQIIKRSMVDVGDVLMPMIGTVGFPVVVKNDCQFAIKNLALFKTANSNKIDTSFLNYFLQSQECDIQFSLESRGGVQNFVSLGTLRDLGFSNPPILEQRTIANFLDHETAKIDTLIEKQQQLIQLLKEKRQAVISHAVTKGISSLNGGPNAPMKDSGVEWLGEVPEGWEVYGLDYALSAIGDVDHYMPKSVDIGIPYVMTGDLKEFASSINYEGCKQISRNDYIALSKKIKCTQGDVIMARYATIGTVSYVDVATEFVVSYSCVTIKPNPLKVIGLYLYYYFKSDAFLQGIQSQINTNTQGNVGISDLKKIKVAIPSLVEQVEIINFLKAKIEKLNSLSEEAERSITLAQERRTALISAAVTGKIDVRSWQAPEAKAQAVV